jgi:WD40 repeat protein
MLHHRLQIAEYIVIVGSIIVLAVISPDGRLIAGGGADSIIKIWQCE